MKTLQTIALAAASLVLAGCVAKPKPKAPTVRVEPESATHASRDATEVVRDIVGGRLSIFVDLAALREHRFAAGLTRMGGLQKTFDLFGVDPLWEVDAAFITSRTVSSCYTGFVLRHRMTAERTEEAFARALEESQPEGARVAGLGFPAIEVTIGEQRRIVAAPLRDHWIVLPSEEARFAADLVATHGLAATLQGKAWTIDAPRAAWNGSEFGAAPSSIDAAAGWITLDNDGAHGVVELHDKSNDPGADARAIDLGIRTTSEQRFLGIDFMPLHPQWIALGSHIRGTVDVGAVLMRALLALPFDRC
jgi:hypothetical protein